MRAAHLTASSFFGGPERQMLGLARVASPNLSFDFFLFPEHGRFAEFQSQINNAGFPCRVLESDFPKVGRCIDELTSKLKSAQIECLLTHGYKSNFIGRLAAKKANIPVVAVSRGWTGENWKVRLYEASDRYQLRFFDAVVAVSKGQAKKVLHCGVPKSKLHVIPNASRLEEISRDRNHAQQRWRQMFADTTAGMCWFAGIGRFSPEKGFDRFIAHAAKWKESHPHCRFVLIGAGVEQENLQRQIDALHAWDTIRILPFRRDLDQLYAGLDGLILTSHTEGLPNVVLEAAAAGIPTLGTAVGGVPELVIHEHTGLLLPATVNEQWDILWQRFLENTSERHELGVQAQSYVQAHFSFDKQFARYEQLLMQLTLSTQFAEIV